MKLLYTSLLLVLFASCKKSDSTPYMETLNYRLTDSAFFHYVLDRFYTDTASYHGSIDRRIAIYRNNAKNYIIYNKDTLLPEKDHANIYSFTGTGYYNHETIAMTADSIAIFWTGLVGPQTHENDTLKGYRLY